MTTKPERRLTLLGSVLAIIGVFLPFYSVNAPEGMGGSMSFIHAGLPGVLALLIAIGLGAISLMPEPSRALNLVGAYLAVLVLGMLLYSSTASGFESASAAAAAGIIGHGFGFYILWVGYLLLGYAYLGRMPR